MKKTYPKGFTLIEILIVVAIIAILSSVVLVGLGPTQRAGRDARRLSDLRQVQTGLELYFGKCGHYPGDAISAGVCPGPSAPTDWVSLTAALVASDLGISQLPKDPTTGRSYVYVPSIDGTRYVLGAFLEDPNSRAFQDSLTGVVNGVDCGQAGAVPLYCVGL